MNDRRQPRVSVVLPTYNHIDYLPHAVRGVLDQSFTDFELIVVNDGSTDGTAEYLQTLTDPRIRVIHQENGRLPKALNTGFQAACGELLTWISADNHCASNFLEKLVAALDACPEAGFAYSAFVWTNEQDAIVDTTQEQNLTYHRVLAGNPGIASFMYRRACQEAVGLYDESLEGAEDWDMWLRILERFAPVYVPDYLYSYRIHGNTMTAAMPDRIRAACRRAFEKALERLDGDVDLRKLYPSLPYCVDRAEAEFQACMDFGVSLLRAPFDAVSEAITFLDAAHSLRPKSMEAALNLAMACGAAGRWGECRTVCQSLGQPGWGAESDIHARVASACAREDRSLLPLNRLYAVDEAGSELFIREQERRLVHTGLSREAESALPNPLSGDAGVAPKYPNQAHFLMIDKCNAKCIMCGGDYFRSDGKRRITLDEFRTMAANLGLERFGRVCLAGAGDPLLNPDLVEIIRFINAEYPKVRVMITTNGIALTERLAAELLSCRVNWINVSLNSALRSTYERIMQVDAFDRVIENVRRFIELRRASRGGPIVQFSSAINRLNIEELPRMVKLAHGLGVASVNVMYCRFYPEYMRHANVENEAFRLQNGDSLFFHQELSDRMVDTARKLAAKCGVMFSAEPLFRDSSLPGKCSWPYEEIMIGFDGEVYPCGGAEVHFREKVESGRYCFGNALTQRLEDFWNGELYRRLRLSAGDGGLSGVCECGCCANIVRPNDIGFHIMEWNERAPRKTEPQPKLVDWMPLVSVIVPTYNRPDTLVEAIASIQAQTYGAIEIIVVNDAGADVGDVVASANKLGNITYINHETNKGLAAARNTGIAAAHGRYIAYLDDDDLFYPKHIETLVTFLENSEFQVAYTDAHRAHQKLVNGKYYTTHRDVPHSTPFDYDAILARNLTPVLCVMHERECLAEVGGFDESLRTHEDWDLWIRMSRKYRLAHISEVTCEFTWREDGSSMTSSKQAMVLRDYETIYHKYAEYSQGKPRVLAEQGERLKYYRGVCDQAVARLQTLSKERHEAGDTPGAIAALEELLRITPSNAEAVNDLGVLHYSMGEVERAIELIEEALRLQPEYDLALQNLADIRSMPDSSEAIGEESTPATAGSASTPVKVSIVIPTYNKLEYTQRCLLSILRAASGGPQQEIIVVDNASTDGSREYLSAAASEVPMIRVVLNAENLGFARACNQGAAEASGEYVLFLNNDTEVTPGWLTSMVEYAEADKGIGVVGARLLYPDGRLQHVGVDLRGDGVPFHAYAGADGSDPAAVVSRDWVAVTGACMLMRKGLFQELGGFDDAYRMYFEDVDLCLRVWRRGLRVSCCADAVVTHYESVSADEGVRDRWWYGSWDIFAERWCNNWPPALRSVSTSDALLTLDAGKTRPQIIWRAPVFDASGYADEARSFILALDGIGLDVAVEPVNWSDRTPELRAGDRERLERLVAKEQRCGSVHVNHILARNFIRRAEARVNVGRTMFETDSLPRDWADACNLMDRVWVPSKFNLETFAASGVRPEKLVVIPGAIDMAPYDPEIEPLPIPGTRGFNFLSVFDWSLRKGWDILVRAFVEEFSEDEDVSLTIKTHSSLGYKTEHIAGMVARFLQNGLKRDPEHVPELIIDDSDLTASEMPRLYAAADCFVLPTHGEGWGRPYMEAMAMGLPTIGTDWGGNTEFMNDANSYPIRYTMTPVPEVAALESATFAGRRWATPDVDHLKSLMRLVYTRRDEGRRIGMAARADLAKRFCYEAVASLIESEIERII